jgi:hypothetical protein
VIEVNESGPLYRFGLWLQLEFILHFLRVYIERQAAQDHCEEQDTGAKHTRDSSAATATE